MDDALGLLARHIRPDGTPLTDADLLSHARFMLEAGYETSASLGAWALYLLTLHPDFGDRVRAEVDLGEEVPAEVLDMIMQVMPYGFDAATWDNSRLLAALAGSSVHFAPIDQSLDAILDYPIRTGWGSVVEPRPRLPAPPRW